MSCPLKHLSKLNLDELESEWMHQIFDGEFVECFDIPRDYEKILDSISLRSIFTKLITDINIWLSHNNPELEKSWSELSKTFEYKKLLALLFYAIDIGSKNINDDELRSCAIIAARLYYKLLTIPGFKAFSIYYSQLFIHSLACLKYPRNICEQDDAYYNHQELVKAVNRTIKTLGPYLEDLYGMVINLEPKPDDNIFEELLNNLIEITGATLVTKMNIDKYELSTVSRLAYQCIDLLLHNREREPDRMAITMLFKCILPKLIAVCMDSKASNNVVRAAYVTYLGLMLGRFGKVALPGFNTLLQHLCYTQDGLEKAEVRLSRVSLVTGLMSLLTKKLYQEFIKWLIKLTKTARAPHRHLALEILSSLLSNESSESDIIPPPVVPSTSGLSFNPLNERTYSRNKDYSELLQNSLKSNPRVVLTPLEKMTADQIGMLLHKNLARLTVIENAISKIAVSASFVTGDIQSTAVGSDVNIKCSGVESDVNIPCSGAESDINIPCSGVVSDANIAEHQVITDNEMVTTGSQIVTNDCPMDSGDNQITEEDIENIIAEVITDMGPLGDTDCIGDLMLPENVPLVGAEASIANEEIQLSGNDITQGISNIAIEPEVSHMPPTNQTGKQQNGSKLDPKIRIKMEPGVVVPMQRHEEPTVSNEEPITIEEDTEPVINHVVHTVPHREFIQAIYERAFDVSSTVRTRALTILTQSVKNPLPAVSRAIKHLNGTSNEPKLIQLAMRCMTDERAVVRKSAVALVDALLQKDQQLITKGNLGVLVDLCRDISLLVRTASITALGESVVRWQSDTTLDAFLAGPMHQLSDPETKIQDSVVDLVQKILIDRLKPYNPIEDYDKALEWMFLTAVTRNNMRRHLQKCIGLLNKNSSNCINHRLVDKINSHIGRNKDKSLEIMVLLSCVARHVEPDDADLLLKYYYELAEENADQCSDVRLLALTLETLGCWSNRIIGSARSELRSRLIHAAAEGHGEARRAAAALAAHLQPDELQWADSLLTVCERACAEGTSAEWSRAADAALFATRPPDRAFIQSLIDVVDSFAQEEHEWPIPQRASAVAALGRVCIRGRAAAVSAAPALARLLTAQTAPLPCRVNALLALTDICTRYTCIMEPLLGDICSCMKAAPDLLRRASARALTRLLLGEYLRLRPPLYFRYCALLADQDEEVREPVVFYVTGCLGNDVICHNFIECIMVYNGCTNTTGGDENAEVFDENLSIDSRQLIYDLMLQRMTIVQKFKIQCKLATEVIGYAAEEAENGSNLTENLENAVKDTIYILRCPHMRLPKKPQTGEAADIDDLTARVTTNIVSQKMKRTVAEVLMPAVMKLYTRLTGEQLATHLVRLITDLLKDYRQEIEEIVDNDPELSEQVNKFQEMVGDETFGNRLNIGLRESNTEPDATPSMQQAKFKKPNNTARAKKARRTLQLRS